MRDRYYEAMLSQMNGQKASGSMLAGFNFWGWGGLAIPSQDHLMWQPGDDYTGDPAQAGPVFRLRLRHIHCIHNQKIRTDC